MFVARPGGDNEAGSSNACELAGLKKCVDKIGSNNIKTLITDRHRGVAKYIREELPNVLHLFDCWHLAKCENGSRK